MTILVRRRSTAKGRLVNPSEIEGTLSHINDKTFKELVNLVYQEAGIVLNDKRELVDARMAGLCRKNGYKTPEVFLQKLKNDKTGDALVELLNQVSTNLTFFFREPVHFDFIKKRLLPELVARKKANRSRRIRFWSAACSSGEEPYSMALVVNDFFGSNHDWDVKILATDISTKVLQKGMIGEYSKQEIIKIPPNLARQYFDLTGTREHSVYRVNNDLRKMVKFRRFNLLQESYPFSGLFDLILCRNVMIYFDGPTKQALLHRFHRYLENGGYLFSGHAESLSSYEKIFKRVQVAVYQK